MRALALGLLCIAGCAHEASRVATPGVDPRSERVVAALVPVVHVKGEPERRWRLDDRMKQLRVPGVSVAVADGGAVVWARGFGVIERGKDAPIAPGTLFQAASISKPVVATATLRLAEQGTLSLDEDVNRYLRSWKLPESELAKDEKVTLRRIVSHTAGLNMHGFTGYRAGEPLPSTVQILDGAAPANTAPIRVMATPGSALRYSGGGVTIEQLVLGDVTGKPFPALMKELVLDPAGMQGSTFDQPLPPDAAARASSAHDASGAPIPGRFMVYPEMAAAGLWSTPRDLLAWAIAIADAYAGRSPRVLAQASARAMLSPVKGPVGLGPFVRGEGRALRFGHPGTNDGFHCELVYFAELGKGAAVMVNGDAGRPLLRELLYAVAGEYGWPDFAPDAIAPFAIDPAARDALVGTYAGKFERIPVDAQVRREGDALFFDSKRLGLNSEMIFVSKTAFVLRDTGDEMPFDAGAMHFGDIAFVRQ